MASRGALLAVFGSVGFAIGFVAFFASTSLGAFLAYVWPNIIIDKNVVFATVSGAAGAGISTAVVSAWAKRP
ncbi:MAG: hypothetical protein ABI361_04975 [Nitrososphaera sp.]|jgi:ABC-type transport system involved in cytochrome c biogenesis permease subunit